MANRFKIIEEKKSNIGFTNINDSKQITARFHFW